MLVNDDSWFFVKSKNPADASKYVYAVMKASEFTKDVTSQAQKQIIYQPVGGINTVVMGVLDVNSALKNSVEDYVFTTTDWYNTTDADNKAIKAIDVINSKGETVTLTLTSTDGVAAYKVYNVSTVSGKSTLSNTTFTLAALTGANTNGILQFDGTTTLSVAKDAKIWYLDCDPATGKIVKVEGDGYPLAEKDGENQQGQPIYNLNALYRVNDDEEVTDLFVEVDGDAFGKIAQMAIVSVSLEMDALTYETTPPVATAANTAKFEVTSTTWNKKTDDSALNGNPDDTTTEYYATIVLTAKDGEEFLETITKDNVSIAGYTIASAAATESQQDEGFDTLTIKTEAKAAAKATVALDDSTNKLTITVTKPSEANDTANFPTNPTTDSDSGVSVSNVKWYAKASSGDVPASTPMEANTGFTANNTYFVQITLGAAANYELDLSTFVAGNLAPANATVHSVSKPAEGDTTVTVVLKVTAAA